MMDLIEALRHAVISADPSGRVTYWNLHAERVFGWKKFEAVRLNLRDIFLNENQVVPSGVCDRTRADESSAHKVLARRKDGTEFPAEVWDTLVFDDAGALVEILRLCRDLSDQVKYEQVVENEAVKYRTLVEAASDGIHTYDSSGQILDANSRLCEMLGYGRHEMLQLNVADLVVPEELAADPIQFDRLLAGDTLLKERRLRRKDGTVFPAEISGKTIEGDLILGIVRDVSERKRAEKTLRRSEERLKTIFENSLDGILVEERDRIVFVNRAYLQLFGFGDPAQLIGRHVSDIVSSKDVDRISDYGRRRLDGLPAPSSYEFQGKRRDGTVVDLEASVSVAGSNGSTFTTTFVRDIGDRRRLSSLMSAQNKALEMLVRGADLHEILFFIAGVVEAEGGESVVASIMVLDEERRLRNGASPHLPQEYLQAIDGLEANVDVGTCCSAAASGEVVITPDIAADPKWVGISHLPLELGLPAAWSMPIVARDGHVLGTFGTYFRERRTPTEFEMRIVEILSRTAALAIEQKQSEEALRNSERQLRLVADAIPLLVSFVDDQERYRFVNRAYTEWFRLPSGQIIGSHLAEILGDAAYRVLRPEIKKALQGEEVSFEQVVPYEFGERYISVNYIPEMDPANLRVIGFHAFVQDISSRKAAEDVMRRSRLDLEDLVEARTAELKKATSQRFEIIRQLVDAQELERQRIAHDLHDQLGQQMVVLRMKIAAVQKACCQDAEVGRQLAEIKELAKSLDDEITFLAWRSRPAVLDDVGIAAALEQYVGRWAAHMNVRATFDAARFGSVRLDRESETVFYRVTQEALNNIQKHANASAIFVCLSRKDSRASLIIEDDGVGFDPHGKTSDRGLGLTGMRERMALIGGSLDVESAEERGTTVYATVPLPNQKEAT